MTAPETFPESVKKTDYLLIIGEEITQVIFQEAQQGADNQRGAN